jgi:carbonic anhydrase
MTAAEDLLKNAENYTKTFDRGSATASGQPRRNPRLHGCAAERVRPARLQEGDAHVIRNAGGVVTTDEIRSIAISQRLLGTKEVILIHHTDCGVLTFNDDDVHTGRLEEVT